MRAVCSSSSHMASFPPGMQRTERLPLLFPRAFIGIAAGKERNISLRFLISLGLGIPKSAGECAGASNVRTRTRSQDERQREVSRDETHPHSRSMTSRALAIARHHIHRHPLSFSWIRQHVPTTHTRRSSHLLKSPQQISRRAHPPPQFVPLQPRPRSRLVPPT